MFVPINQLTYTLLRNTMSMIVARKARANIRSIINIYSLFLSDQEGHVIFLLLLVVVFELQTDGPQVIRFRRMHLCICGADARSRIEVFQFGISEAHWGLVAALLWCWHLFISDLNGRSRTVARWRH